MSTALDEALALERAGDLDGAVIALEGVLSGRPRHPVALARLAGVQFRRGRLEEAVLALDRAEAAMAWAGRAIELARRLDDPETLSHALTNIGTVRLVSSDLGG